MAKEDLTLNIKADVRKATAEIKKINKTLEQFKKEQQQIQKESLKSAKSLESFNKRITQMAHITASLAGLDMTIGKIIDIGEAYEKTISKLGAISKASSEDLALLSDKAKELGLKTQYSAKQVADAMNYEAMAGMKTNQILGATKDILDLASVGNMDLAKASDIATDTMSAFGMKADEVGKITDIMAVTITNSNTNVEQLGEAFKNVAPVAHNLGLSIEQTSAMLGVLADSGKKGGEAGTHLKIILQRLASQTKQVQVGFKKLGLSAYDSNGKLKPMTETLTKIKDKLKNLNDKQKNTILKDLFGEEAISSANIILNNLDKMDIKLKKISNSEGEAAKMAKKMNDNLAGDKLKLNSALESLANNLYEHFLPALRESVQTFTEFIQYLSENDEQLIKYTKDVIELVTEIYALKKIMNVLSFLKTAKELAQVNTIFELFIVKIKDFSKALILLATTNPILSTLAVTIGLVVLEWNNLMEAEQKQIEITNKLNEANKLVNGTIEELYSKHLNKTTKQLELTNEEVKKYKKNIDDLIKSTKKQIETAKENSDGSVEYKNTISELNKKLKLLQEAQKGVNNAKIIQAQKEITQNTNKQAQSVEILTAKQKKYIKSLDDELKKQTRKKQTLKEWYQFQLKKLDEMLQGTKEYYLAKEKLEKIYLYKLKDSYNKRIVSHSNTINKLEKKEKNLSDKIVAIQKDLQNKLKTIELSRINAIEDIENKIHNISISNLSSYMQYNDKKKQSDILYNKAKIALQDGELSQAKKYMSQYESIVSNLANTEIKENGKVVVSKRQSNQDAIKGLKSLENLTNDYYDKQKAKEIETHNQKIAQLKAELSATKAQIQLEVQRLNLEKQLVEVLTGKKLNIDTSSALNSIENLDKQIKSLDNQIEKPKKVELDTKEPQETKIKVDADTAAAKRAILEVKNTSTGEITKIPIGANTKQAKASILEVKNYATGEVTKIKINSDVSKALANINKIPKVIVTKHIIKTIEEHNLGGIVGKFATGGKIDDFERKNGRINGYDPSDSDDVPAMLTRGEFVVKRDAVKHYGDDFLYKLNNKMLPKYATGGIVETSNPQRNTNLYSKSEDDNSILNKFNDFMNKYLTEYRKIYYSPGANEATMLFLPKKPTGNEFLKTIGIKDTNLAKQYTDIIKNIDPRVFTSKLTLNKDVLKQTELDLNKLPKFQNGGAINAFAGGKLNGYGGGDKNLALLEDGEFIVRKEAVSHFGSDFLHTINKIKLPKFQNGGMFNITNLPKFQNGGLNNSNTTNINFKMPSGKSYNMQSSESVAQLLAQEFRSL